MKLMGRRLRWRYGVVPTIIGGLIALTLLGGGTYALLLGGGIIPSSSTDIDLQRGLVGHWKFDGNAKDSTPYAHNGTASGVTLASDRKGKANSAYSVPGGTTNSVNVAHTTKLSPTGNITVSTWMRPSTASQASFARLVTKYDGTNINYLMAYDTTNKMRFIIDSDTSARSTALSTTVLTDTNRWYHIVGVRSGSTVSIYIDGVLEHSTAFSGSTNKTTTTQLQLGGGAGNSFTGTQDDTRVYERALSEAEVKAMYDQYDPGLKLNAGAGGLVGHWKLDNGAARDSTPYASNGTLFNATATTDRKNQASRALSFTGDAGSYATLGNHARYQVNNGTLSAWVRTTTPGSSYRGVIVKQSAYGIFLANGLLYSYNWATSGVIATSTNLADGNWHHVAMTFQSGVTNGTILYADGAPVLTTTITIANQASPLNLATGFGGGSGQTINGSIDDARMYNRVLTGTEVANLAQSYDSQINLYRGADSTVNLASGLVGYWPFNGNSKDATPYTTNMTLLGNTALTTDRRGRSNSAYTFDGTGDYMQNAAPNTAVSLTNNFTLAGWIYPTAYHTTGYFNLKNGIIAKGPAATFNYALQATDATTISFIKRTSPESLIFFNFTGIPSMTNTWTHVLATVTGGTVSLYINGTLHSSQAITNVAPGPSDVLYFGTSAGGNSEGHFYGKLDDLRIYNRALNSSEISALGTNYY